MAGRPRTAETTTDDDPDIRSRSVTLLTSRGAVTLRAVSARALGEAAADVHQFARTTHGLIVEPAPVDLAKLPLHWVSP